MTTRIRTLDTHLISRDYFGVSKAARVKAELLLDQIELWECCGQHPTWNKAMTSEYIRNHAGNVALVVRTRRDCFGDRQISKRCYVASLQCYDTSNQREEIISLDRWNKEKWEKVVKPKAF